jgi:hypothetical protein
MFSMSPFPKAKTSKAANVAIRHQIHATIAILAEFFV